MKTNTLSYQGIKPKNINLATNNENLKLFCDEENDLDTTKTLSHRSMPPSPFPATVRKLQNSQIQKKQQHKQNTDGKSPDMKKHGVGPNHNQMPN